MLISYSVAHAGLQPKVSIVYQERKERGLSSLSVDIEVVAIAFDLVDDDDFVGIGEEELLSAE